MSMQERLAKASPEEYEYFMKEMANTYQRLGGEPNENIDFVLNAKPGELAELRRKAIEEEKQWKSY